MSSPSVVLPLDLIVGVTMHSAWSHIEHHPSLLPPREQIPGVVARDLLSAIAKNADLTTVLAALSAVGAPASLDMIREGLRAVGERQSGPVIEPEVPPLTIKAPPASPPEAAS